MNYDLVVLGGRLIDPASGIDSPMNVGIKGNVISAVSPEDLKGREVINAAGLVVSPGFIDIHAHEDFTSTYTIPVETSKMMVLTGVTTMVGGNCGFSGYPVGAYLENIARNPIAVNYYMLVGYNSLREKLGIGQYDSVTPSQIDKLQDMVGEGLSSGALGVSFGLHYAPGVSSEEMLVVARTVAEQGKLIAVHMRYNYPEKAMNAVDEIIEIAQRTGVRMQLSHLAANIYGGDNMKIALQKIADANKKGFDVAADTYPYNAWATTIKSAVFDAKYFAKYNFTYEDMEILTGPHAGERCTSALFHELREAVMDTLVACHNAVPYNDVLAALKSPFVSLCSDGQIVKDPTTGELKGHPRSAGSPAKFLGRMVREEGILGLEEALEKLTSKPAKRLRLCKKGNLREGSDADICIFDPEKIVDKSRFGINVCALPPEGIAAVIIGGKVMLNECI